MSVASKRPVMSFQSCHFHVYTGQILAPCHWESGSAFTAPGVWLRCRALCSSSLGRGGACHTRGFFSARDVFIQVMDACNQPVFMIFLFQGAVVAGWRFLYSESGRQAATTGGVKERKGWADAECGMREGSSVPPPPVFLRPRVCFKLLQALQPRLRSVRRLETGGERVAWFCPLSLCVWEEEWYGVWLSTWLFKPKASPGFNWGCLFALRPEVLLLLVSQKEVSPGSV